MLEMEGTTNQIEVHDQAILSHARSIIDACSSPEGDARSRPCRCQP